MTLNMRVKINDQKISYFFNKLTESGTAFKARLIRLGVSSETVDTMIRDAPVVIKRDLTLGVARQYADTIFHAGGKVTIQEHGCFNKSEHINRSIFIASFKDFTRCPECGYKHPRAKDALSAVTCIMKNKNTEGSNNGTGY